jgi:hypothetical protein
MHVVGGAGALGDRAGEAGTLYNLSALERARGNLPAALTHIESAVSIVESLCVKIGSRALQASVRGRARSLLESLAEANADIRR